ncbi:GreA/GreB family elongation factor [Flavobacterium lacus]|jgi:regulator of nucleoside diphosphate kinase|uniref:Regulator of nucleoside diphosphate kinase n=1 Tax=Flavobacterium lacus TaxID=1353778 RepID=A0A328WPC1_9FLAO|nr:GreA/GreB family elongation factor [Flavobacterium lacus]RAR48152.1 regulator of nucleoside diphosphate kinase [Flavobacterium lacus]
MKYEKVVVDRKELEVLKTLFSTIHNGKDKTYRLSFEKLMEEIKNAKVLDSSKMPLDVIRLNSVVTIKTDFGGEKKFHLVTPEKSDLTQNKLSVMAPMGLALFGYAENDEVEWEFPSGLNTIRITKVEQPL